MQDRFRFRVWDIPSKKMRGLEGKWRLRSDGVLSCSNPAAYVLMQCTGFKDKNGKFIYEGDIIKQKYAASDNERIDIVEYGITSCGCCTTVHGFAMQNDAFNIFENFDDCFLKNNLEVIGNIYENHELINNEK